MHDPLRVLHQQLVERAARHDVLADDRRRDSVSKARELDHESVGQRPRAQRIGNACNPLTPDERDLDRVTTAGASHDRNHSALDEVHEVRRGARLAKHSCALERMRFREPHQAAKNSRVHLSESL